MTNKVVPTEEYVNKCFDQMLSLLAEDRPGFLTFGLQIESGEYGWSPVDPDGPGIPGPVEVNYTKILDSGQIIAMVG